MKERFDRRRFLRLGAVSLAYPFLAKLEAFASPRPRPALPPDRGLAFFNTHTGESLDVDYCLSGCLLPDSLGKIDHILRDHRTGEVKRIDVELLDLLHVLAGTAGIEGPYHIISGYRSPQTNESLRAQSDGVAARSLHLAGKAIDVRVPGLALRDLYRAAVGLQGGGVGIYPASDFVHLDVGRVRTW